MKREEPIPEITIRVQLSPEAVREFKRQWDELNKGPRETRVLRPGILWLHRGALGWRRFFGKGA